MFKKETLLIVAILFFALYIKFIASQTVNACNPNHLPAFDGFACDPNTQPACEYGFQCVNNICVRKTNINTTCFQTAECTGVGLRCIAGICAPKRYPTYGCTKAADCITTTCVSGACVGRSAGSSCDIVFDNRCDSNLFCLSNGITANGTCTTNLAVNAACNAAIGVGVPGFNISRAPSLSVVSACASPNICDLRQNKCIRPGTTAVNTDATRPSDCFFGNLAFDPVNQRCVNYCGTGQNDPVCASGLTCVCSANGQAGVCPTDPCITQKEAILDCMSSASPPCKAILTGEDLSSLIWSSLTVGTCIQRNCQRQVWDYECCITNFGTTGELTPGITCTDAPTPTPIPDTASVLSSGFVLLFTVIFFIFIVHL